MMWNGQHLRALMVKDLRLHRRELAFAFAAWFGLCALWAYSRRGRPESTMLQVFFVNALASAFWGEWLVSREKTTGTFAWLRTLPISDSDLVASKFASQALWCSALWIPSSLLLAHDALLPNRWPVWGVLYLTLLAGGASIVATRWRFQQKAAQAAPLAAGSILAMVFIIANSAGLDGARVLADWWVGPFGKAGTAALLTGAYGGIIWATGAWVSRSETTRFLE